MEAPNEKPTSKRVWITSCVFFLLIASGGTLLALSMALPDDESKGWIPIVGMILVGIPWVFWLVTCFYRIMKVRFSGNAIDPLESNLGRARYNEDNPTKMESEDSERPLARSKS